MGKRLKSGLPSLQNIGSFPFKDDFWPGYESRRHQTGKSFRRNRPSVRSDNYKQDMSSNTHVFINLKCPEECNKEYILGLEKMKETVEKFIEKKLSLAGGMQIAYQSYHDALCVCWRVCAVNCAACPLFSPNCGPCAPPPPAKH